MSEREIKFRAWVTYANKMFHVRALATGHDGVKRITLVGNVERNPNTGSAWYSKVPSDMITIKHAILMQYTGLKDKNGVEIYEGDIVMGLGVVRWYDKDAKYMLYFNDGKHPTVEILAAVYSEVIGNIYENPELLEAK